MGCRACLYQCPGRPPARKAPLRPWTSGTLLLPGRLCFLDLNPTPFSRLQSVTMYVKHSKLYNRSASPPGGRQELEALQDVAPADSAIGEADPAVQGDEEEAQEEGQKLEGEQDPSAPLPPDVIAAMLRKVQQGMNTTLEIARLRGAAIR